ncbi:hypothetical protein FRC02_005174 [Tulasnella sp. 418]|nr:hypothetical protein FRC02_005174 [Tulasnella sp. 418]
MSHRRVGSSFLESESDLEDEMEISELLGANQSEEPEDPHSDTASMNMVEHIPSTTPDPEMSSDGDQSSDSESDSDTNSMESFDRLPMSHTSTSHSSQSLTSVTPLMGAVAQEFFLADMNILGEPLETQHLDELESERIRDDILEQDAKARGKAIWGLSLDDADDEIDHFKSVFIDGVEYNLGDIVLIECGEDSHKSRAQNALSAGAQSANAIANSFWFAQIISLFDDPQHGRKKFHARWLVHGSKTVLKEMAHTQELFLTNECDDLYISSIVTHCNCDASPLPIGEEEPTVYGNELEDVHPSTHFFYRFFYNKETRAFVDAHKYATTEMNLLYAQCHSCAQTQMDELQQHPYLTDNGKTLSFAGQTYHCHDFIYFQPNIHGREAGSVVYGLAQILEILPPLPEEASIKIKIVCLAYDLPDSSNFHDERLLFYSKTKKIIDATRIAKKFFALPQDTSQNESEWLKHLDTFYIGGMKKIYHSNRNKKVDDTRHTLSINALSFVDIYRPKYFILENVRGMSFYTLYGRGKTRSGSKMGLVKIIMRCLLAMGYQVHCNLLQAGAYGAPQSRFRLIFLAAKRGLPLPEFPIPTHSFPHQQFNIDMNDGYDAFKPPNNHIGPFPAVTVDDALSDLPLFDW